MQIKQAMAVAPEPVEGVPGVTIRRLWAEADRAPTFALRLFEIQPGMSTPYHHHAHEHEIYVLSGRARLRGEDQEHVLEPGATVLVKPHEMHQFQNAGSDTLRFLCAIPHLRDLLPVTAQVSLYALRQEHLGPSIERAIGIWRSAGLEVEPGPMSTLLVGDDAQLWPALRQAFATAARDGEAVMSVTVSNACPRPEGEH
ncbi:MAG: cupin domain-containing protein [Chloroflexota bacterium]